MSLVLEATKRSAGKLVNNLRSKGFVPAVVYGNHKEPQALSVSAKEVESIFKSAGESTLVDLVIDKQSPIQVLIHASQRHPLHNRLAHVDFFEVNMSEKITTDIQLEFIGESKAVKELGGTLVKNKTEVKMECLPADLVHQMTVDISKLQTFDDHVTIADLAVPKGITLLEKPEDVIALVEPPRSEKELEELEEKVEEKVDEVEVEKKGKKEEEGEAGTDAADTTAQTKESSS